MTPKTNKRPDFQQIIYILQNLYLTSKFLISLKIIFTSLKVILNKRGKFNSSLPVITKSLTINSSNQSLFEEEFHLCHKCHQFNCQFTTQWKSSGNDFLVGLISEQQSFSFRLHASHTLVIQPTTTTQLYIGFSTGKILITSIIIIKHCYSYCYYKNFSD